MKIFLKFKYILAIIIDFVETTVNNYRFKAKWDVSNKTPEGDKKLMRKL